MTTREESLTAGRVLEARMVVMPVREAPPFTMVGLHWQGSGELWFRAAGTDSPLGLWIRAECCERPDDDSNEAGLPDWHLGKPAWTGPATRIQYRYRGEISALRAHFVYSEPVAGRRMSAAGGPAVIPRSEWIANEELVRAEPLVAERLRLALLHHTAAGAPATPEESAAIIRGIQVYHVEANGWDDIGYNFLVDPFGQVFEGRAGGIERNVVGAHAQGFNTGSVGIAVLGYYQEQGITAEVRAALINLLAWRLDVAHVDPQTLPNIISRGSARYPSHVPVIMRAVSGHRDIDLTTCPGDHLYAELSTLAAHASFVGLPKLYDPRVEGTLGGPVRFTARFSQELWWSVVVTDGARGDRGAGRRRGRGRGLDVGRFGSSRRSPQLHHRRRGRRAARHRDRRAPRLLRLLPLRHPRLHRRADPLEFRGGYRGGPGRCTSGTTGLAASGAGGRPRRAGCRGGTGPGAGGSSSSPTTVRSIRRSNRAQSALRPASRHLGGPAADVARFGGHRQRSAPPMISKFSVLYVGHLDLEDVGLGGKPADERWYPNERFQEAYWTAREVAQMMDERGFWCLWTAEHHFQREGYEVFPNLILLNTWLATQTQRLKLGCAFNVLPTWHPIRLAEDYAVADIVTGGRIVFGIGRGYQTREVESLGAPLLDGDANRELFEEQVELLMKALNEESFSHQGRHYQVPAPVEYRGRPLENVTLVPRPLNRPVEVWQAIASGRSIPYMAHRGIKGMISLTGEQIALEMAELYQAEAAKVGRELELGDGLCLGFGLYLADSEQEAIDRVRPYHDERYKWFAQFGSFATRTSTAASGELLGRPHGYRPSRTAWSRRPGSAGVLRM